MGFYWRQNIIIWVLFVYKWGHSCFVNSYWKANCFRSSLLDIDPRERFSPLTSCLSVVAGTGEGTGVTFAETAGEFPDVNDACWGVRAFRDNALRPDVGVWFPLELERVCKYTRTQYKHGRHIMNMDFTLWTWTSHYEHGRHIMNMDVTLWTWTSHYEHGCHNINMDVTI